MIAPLAKFIDWSALQMAYAVVGLKHAPKPKWKLEEALEFLNGPDFIPAASDPARIVFDGPRHFKFPTPRPGKVEENNIVYGRLYRCAARWQERPVIILLDGYPAVGYHSAFPLLARRFNRAGFNVATLVAGQFDSPSDVCYDPYFDQIIVADTGNNRIQMFQLNSYGDYSDNSIIFVKEVAEQGLSSPSAVACTSDETSQYIYVADTGNNKVLKLATPLYPPGASPLHAFEKFKGSLAIDDIPMALTCISDASYDTYLEILYAIESELPDFASGMGTMTLTSYEPGRAKYEMQHQDGENTYSFPVIFSKDNHGYWKIFEF